jgi:hypothetical protein
VVRKVYGCIYECHVITTLIRYCCCGMEDLHNEWQGRSRNIRRPKPIRFQRC